MLSRLVDDLFELARIESGVLALELRELPLTPVVEGCLVGVAAEAPREAFASRRSARAMRLPASPPRRSSASF